VNKYFFSIHLTGGDFREVGGELPNVELGGLNFAPDLASGD
jgi:hypothetical protein